jgi:metal-responsive CopG/Arc/MetJ family transcriptional regulator
MVNKKERVQFDITTDRLEELDAIVEKTGASTRAEVLRDAMRFYEWLVEDNDPNDTIEVINGQKELVQKMKVKTLLGWEKKETV